ncbi:hypothetical protein T265_04960 [Opisthorchis viverrini]|uniref:Uncharacterized protein n=1 Tax=Opisthorchis viverrini TaxID=6198 RepID=A0A074ZQM5_OPIVI|nr:hypothetical protein T265_04960 [Opisthorchis viverrini]KER28122.1 hypothetical protein T265_04960 [Opisthorchis viverrini]
MPPNIKADRIESNLAVTLRSLAKDCTVCTETETTSAGSEISRLRTAAVPTKKTTGSLIPFGWDKLTPER